MPAVVSPITVGHVSNPTCPWRIANSRSISWVSRFCQNVEMRDLVMLFVQDIAILARLGPGDLRSVNLSKIRRAGQEQKRVNVDFPIWMIRCLDSVATRLGVPRQSVIKVWVAEAS